MVSLTSGIPQSSANPLLTILDGEEERRRKRAEWQAKAIDNLDAAVLDWDGFTRDKPQPPLNFAADPETAKKLGIVHSYLAIQSPTATAPEDPVTRSVFRDKIAQERFAGRGVGDDLAFYGEIEKEVTGRKDARLLMQDATSTAATAAILSAAGEPGTTYDQWITAARQRPGYRPDLEDVYFSEWRDRQRDLAERMAPVRDLVARQWTAMKEGKTADLEGLEGLMADEDQRETLLLAIGGLVKALPKDQQPGVLANLRKQFLRRDLPLQAEGVMASLRPFDRDEPLPAEYLDQLEPGTNLQAFEKRQRAAFEKDTQLRERFVRKLESIVFDQYDPVVTFAKEGSNWQALEKGLYAAPGVGLTIGTAMIPGAGNFISYEVLRQTSTDMARDSLVQGGFTEDQADQAAQGIGTVSALIQLPMERLGLAAVTNRLPFVKKAIGKLTSNLATRYLARAGSSTLVEFGTEMGQDLVPYIVQEMGKAAGQDMPGVQWTGQGGVFHNYDQKSLEVVGAILPLSLIMAGGGVINDRQIQQVAALDDVTLQAAGMSPDAVAAVRAANGIGEQELALRSAWESRDVNSETALAAQQELTARTQADQQIASEATQAGAMPTFYRSADGWSVRDGESGTEIGTSTTADGALRLAMAHSSAIEEENADQIAALATLLDAGDVVASTDQEGVRTTETDLRPGQVVTTAQQAAQSEQDEIRIRQQTEARERLGGGDGGTARMVLGKNVTEFRQKVRNTVNRINAGGSVLTVFHESNHGFFREALATGRLTKEETLAAIRAIETVLAGKTTKEGDQLVFLSDPETFAGLSQKDQDAELDEAVSELMDAEILRTRKTGSRKSPGHKIPPGLVTRNLTAMARLAPGAAQKLRDFIAAVRAFWGLTFQRAAAIKSAIREGKLDETQLEAFKSKLFGLEDQTDLEQAARDTEARILDGIDTAAELDGDPFSLGPAITPEQDAAYLAAVEAGERGKAEAMVMQAAASAGYTIKAGHATPFEFEAFDRQFIAADDPDTDIRGFHVSTEPVPEAAYVSSPASNAPRTRGKIRVIMAFIRPGRTIGRREAEKLVRSQLREKPGDDAASFPDGFDTVIFREPTKQPTPEERASYDRGELVQISNGYSIIKEEFEMEGKKYESANLVRTSDPDSVITGYLDLDDAVSMHQEGHYIVRDPSQIKSADMVTRDEAGNVIPLSQRFNPADDRLAYSLGPAALADLLGKDAAYLAAVEAGNMEEAQGMVDAAARAAGYDIGPVFHGSNSGTTRADGTAGPITRFNTTGDPTIDGSLNTLLGSFFSEAQSTAELFFDRPDQQTLDKARDHREIFERPYYPNLYRVFLKFENFADWTGKDSANQDAAEDFAREFQDFMPAGKSGEYGPKAKLRALGFDGIKISHKTEGTTYIALDANQIKSADPVTRDEAGNVIPLSQRFNSADDRIAYSLGPAALADLLGKDAISRIKDPVRRAQAMSRVAREMEAARLQFERLELVAGSKRLKKSLAREAAIRTALRREELENEAWARHWQILSDDDLTKIKQQPAHKLLGDPKNPMRGRIQSRTATIAKNPELYTFKDPAEYNGSEAVSRSVFGGTLTPDLAVEQLVEEGLLPPGSKPDAMWQLLEAEALSVTNRKRDLEIAKQELREARTQATDETNVWLREQGVVQETTFGDKQEILRALGVLDGILSSVPAEIRGKIGGYTQLARIATNEAKLAFLKDRLAKVDTELEKYLRDQFDREFRALLDKAKPDKDEAGKKPRGKITPTIHALFRAVEDAMTMSGAEVEAEAARLESLANSGDYTAEEENHLNLTAGMILLAGNWAKASAAQREAALIQGTKLFEAGYMARKIELSKQRERRAKTADTFQTATKATGDDQVRRDTARKQETRRGAVAAVKANLLSFEGVLQEAFGLDSPEVEQFVTWERQAANAKQDALQHKYDLLDDLLASLAGGKFKGEQLRAKLQDPDAVTWVDWKGNRQSVSELQAAHMTMFWRQEDGRRHMEGHLDEVGKPIGEWHYRQQDIDLIEDQLTDNAKAIRLHLSETYAAEWERINAVFEQNEGVSLPRHKLYAPVTVDPAQAQANQMLDPTTGNVASPSFTPGSLRNRSQSAIAKPNFDADALQVYLGHIRQMEHYIAYSTFAREMMAVTNRREVRDAIKETAGPELQKVLGKYLDYFATGSVMDPSTMFRLNRMMSGMMNRFAAATLVGRVSVLAIQSTQLLAAWSYMPTGAYLSRLGRLMAGRLDWSGALASKYIQRRKDQMPATIQQLMEGLRSAKPSRLIYTQRKMGETIAGADALFTAGTFAITYDYHLARAKKQGMTGQQATDYALEQAEAATDRVAQPVRPGTRSILEITSTNPAFKMLWNFASDARQKLAIAAFQHADRTPMEKARALGVVWLAGGIVSTIIRSAMRDIRDDGEDDDIFDEKNWDPARLGLQALTGPVGGLPYIGDALESAIFAAAGEYLPSSGTPLDNVTKAVRPMKQLLTGDIDGAGQAMKDGEAILSAGALFDERLSALNSLSHVARDLFGIVQNVTD